jgi:hypothetical protein
LRRPDTKSANQPPVISLRRSKKAFFRGLEIVQSTGRDWKPSGYFSRTLRCRKPPGCAFADRGDHVVVGFVKIIVVIFIVDDGLTPMAGCGAIAQDLQADAIGMVNAVAVRQQEIADRHQIVAEPGRVGETGADEKPPFRRGELSLGALLRQFDKFMAARCADDLVRERQVDFIADFEKHVARAARDQPVD